MTARPGVGVGAVVLRDGRLLLVRRGNEPLRGRWVVPGGRVEWGERLEEAVVREVREETGILVRPREVLLVLDRLDGTPVTSHWVIIDYWCDDLGGTLSPGSDATDAAWVSAAELDAYDVPEAVRGLARAAWRRAGLVVPGVDDTLSR